MLIHQSETAGALSAKSAVNVYNKTLPKKSERAANIQMTVNEVLHHFKRKLDHMTQAIFQGRKLINFTIKCAVK